MAIDSDERSNDKHGAQGRERIVALDGLRGLAILLVLVYHYADQFFHDATLGGIDYHFVDAGRSLWFGVDLFFVLSGFLITGILCRTRRQRDYYKTFFGRRTVRIFPLYFASLFLLCVLLPRLHESFANPKLEENQRWFWTYLSNFLYAWEGNFGKTPGGYYWSVAVEEQFYLVWPFVIWAIEPRKLARFVWFLLISGIVVRCLLLVMGATSTAVYVLPFTHMDSLLLGSLVAVSRHTYGAAEGLPTRQQMWIPVGTSVLGLLYMGRHGHLYFWDYGVAALGMTMIAVLCVCLLCALLRSPESRLAHAFSNPFLCSFGKYSYAIYLCHVPIGRALERIFFPTDHVVAGSVLPSLFAFVLIAAIISWCAGFLSWHLFEKHFLQLKKYF